MTARNPNGTPSLSTNPLDTLPGSTFARLAPLCLAMFCGFSTIGIPLPVLPLYVHGPLGFGLPVAGLSVGIQSFATLLTRPYAGRSVDGLGAKTTLIRGLALASCAGLVYLVSVLVPPTPLGSLLTLLVGRLVLGVGESLLITGILSWAILRAGAGRSGTAMSWNGMAQYAALAAGAPAGLAIYGQFGFGGIAVSTVVLPLLATSVVWGLPGVPPMGGRRMPLLSVLGRIWHPGLGLMLSGLGFAALSTFTSLTFAYRHWPAAGLALTAFGAAFIGVRLVAGGLPDRHGGRTIAVASLAVEAVGQMLMWLAPDPLVAVAGAALTGLGCALVFPSLGVEMVGRVPIENRGVALGAFAAFQDLAIGMTGPLLGGPAAIFGPPVAFLGGLLACLAGTIVCFTLKREGRPPRPT